jgi:two-component system, NtrC family, response regulator AtoC
MTIRVAVIDDEEVLCKRLKRALEREGYEVETFAVAEPFFMRMAQQRFHIVFTDLRLPDMDGIAVLGRIREIDEEAEVILITGYATLNSAIEAIKRGAYHYIAKPLKLDEIRLVARNAAEKTRLEAENRQLREALAQQDSFANIVGKSPPMQDVFSLVRKVAAVDCNLLIQGPSGTGKELVARAVHVLSPRKGFPFISFNCGGFTEELISSELFGYEKGAFTGATATKIGLFEAGSKGTVFLDEIGEMPTSMQVKLLHVIQEKRIFRVGGVKPIDLDIRLIAATNRDLRKEVEAGNFREDLFYRLNVVTLQMPTLAERRDDIPLLIAHFIDKYNRAFSKTVKGIAEPTLELLLQYNFPGNIRELKNMVERAVALTEHERIQIADLPPDLQGLEFKSFAGEALEPLEEIEKRYIARVLQKTNYNKHLAARILGLPRTTLWRRMKEYNLEDQS